MPTILRPLFTDPGLHLLIVLTPLLIALDILSGVGNALKQRSFSFMLLANFAGNDLLRYATILVAVAGAMLGGMPVLVAVHSEQAALSVLDVTILTSLALHLQQVTGIPIAFWETLLHQSNLAATGGERVHVQQSTLAADGGEHIHVHETADTHEVAAPPSS